MMSDNYLTVKLVRKRILTLKAKKPIKSGNKNSTDSTTITETTGFTLR